MRKHIITATIWFLILTATIIAYWPALISFFHGDDFVHLQWLSQAINHPELIWRNFHSAWLDVSTAQFYRPLISIFMLMDYCLGNKAAFAFHLTNLICHLINVFLLYLILINITKKSDTEVVSIDHKAWSLLAAALFALYPLHSEAVAWITGRVDVIVTMFFLSSLWCYIRWRLTNKTTWLIGSVLSFALSLLSKEMAATLPLVILTYELIFAQDESSFKTKVISALRFSLPFWIILAIYLIVRTLALGTFVGGYDNTISLGTSMGLLQKAWKQSLGIALIPTNNSLFLPYDPLKNIWLSWLISSFFLGLLAYFLKKDEQKSFFFLFTWLILAFLPVLKLLNISPDLQGSRLAYLPSAPLCALLSFGIAFLPVKSNTSRCVRVVLISLMLFSAAAILTVNNLAWLRAGDETKAILQNLNILSKNKSEDKAVYFIGLPDSINGAYVARNALDGMTKAPQITSDLKNVFMLSNFDRVFPFGFARNNLQNGQAKILSWNSEAKSFQPVTIPNSKADLALIWPENKIFTFTRMAQKKRKDRFPITLELGSLPCWQTQFLTVQLRDLAPNFDKTSKTISLLYTNDLQKEFDPAYRSDCQLLANTDNQKLTFPLHSEVNWAMGGTSHKLELLLPEGKYFLSSVLTELVNTMMPSWSFKSSPNQNKIGFIELNPHYPNCQLDLTAEQLDKATKVGLEITQPNSFFVLHQATEVDPLAKIYKKYPFKKGKIDLGLNDFPKSGIYEIRLRAFADNDQQIGFAGDHLVVTVSH